MYKSGMTPGTLVCMLPGTLICILPGTLVCFFVFLYPFFFLAGLTVSLDVGKYLVS